MPKANVNSNHSAIWWHKTVVYGIDTVGVTVLPLLAFSFTLINQWLIARSYHAKS
ncbi:hypothetical protein [Motilimonas sp. 1_MG-2023]|uniref:hypothetical protein n=1 Tax=Motilimonas TaxID=1914248 RepID=UPI0026E401FE|nr:hypothetical protein [Motilimonas sp. 1_MG-2023]MDO6525583.1 hypothetical protein [Motilimonas sp. 1_MG-2023]